MVVGMLAFGGKWDSLLGLDPTGLYPIKVAEDHEVQAKKVGRGQALLVVRLGAECADLSTLLPPSCTVSTSSALMIADHAQQCSQPTAEDDSTTIC